MSEWRDEEQVITITMGSVWMTTQAEGKIDTSSADNEYVTLVGGNATAGAILEQY